MRAWKLGVTLALGVAAAGCSEDPKASSALTVTERDAGTDLRALWTYRSFDVDVDLHVRDQVAVSCGITSPAPVEIARPQSRPASPSSDSSSCSPTSRPKSTGPKPELGIVVTAPCSRKPSISAFAQLPRAKKVSEPARPSTERPSSRVAPSCSPSKSARASRSPSTGRSMTRRWSNSRVPKVAVPWT